jgi:hypothetical protein
VLVDVSRVGEYVQRHQRSQFVIFVVDRIRCAGFPLLLCLVSQFRYVGRLEASQGDSSAKVETSAP